MSQHRGHRRRPRTPGPPVRSIRPFKSSEQYLEAMKEDLAEWLRDLYGLDIDAANFLQVLETGLVLCRHANTVTEAALAFLAEAPDRAPKIPMPQAGVFCNGAAQPGTFQARDNISNFIQWCRKEMGIQAHKPGSFLKPPGPPVQHEVKVQDGPSQPQPTMTISRSQSPLPPVDWSTYTSSSRKLRPPTPSSPRPHGQQGAGARTLRETAPLLRSQERPMTPSQRTSSPSPQFSSICRSPDLRSTMSGKREKRCPGELLRGRTPPTSWVHKATDSQGTHTKALTSQRLQSPEATSKGTSVRGPSPPPRSSSLANPHSIWLLHRGASPQLREPMPIQSPPPSKGFTKIPIRLSPTRPPTPRSFLGNESGGSMERGSIPSKALTGNLDIPTHGHHSVEASHGDHQMDIQMTSEMEDPRSLGTHKCKGRHTPLPLGRTREQALYHSLEEEIVANMKLLEVGAACNQGTRPQVIPRSGVYVPSLGGRWPESGGPYDKVIQELVQGPPPLLKVDLKAWKVGSEAPPKPSVGPRSPKEKPQSRESGPRIKASPTAKGTPVRTVSSARGKDCSTLTVPATPEAPTHSGSDPSSDKARVCLGKGKRTLRKPQKIPSIYKLKLRPRIRPRRDHRPEKRPSRIPKPLAYLCLGPARTAPGSRLLKATLGGKGGGTCQVDQAGEKKEEEKEKETSISLANSSQVPASQKPDGAPLPPEEESWV